MIIETDNAQSDHILYISRDMCKNNIIEVTAYLYRIDDDTHNDLILNKELDDSKNVCNLSIIRCKISDETNENILEFYYENEKYTLKKENDYYFTTQQDIKKSRKEKLKILKNKSQKQ